MLLKYTQSEKKSKLSGNARQRSAGNMKLIVGASMGPRLPRKAVKGVATKRPSFQSRSQTGREEHRTPVDACDNSNDSGLGFDQHLDISGSVQPTLRLSERESLWINDHPEVKRTKLEIKLESDDATDNFSFTHAMSRSHKTATQTTTGMVSECLIPESGNPVSNSGLPRSMENSGTRLPPARIQSRTVPIMTRRPAGPVSLSSHIVGATRDGKIQLQITTQPEQQHRARYQTEGSRGAVKDRSGNGFPIVKLIGYNKPTTLQVFIGNDLGRIAPHMFYQACKVSGKNSTPCVEKKIEGTIVIEVDFDPSKDMTITCDCVGILKERNVDVEHRFPDQTGTRNKKKSTRCRMVFRTAVILPDGSTEILQISSNPIVCTQPPGIPEISKKSLTTCPCTGGMELFILGKNFLKDTRVIFQQNDTEPLWEESVTPDKEFLQQTHLVCTVPAYQRCDILEPVVVRLLVTSSGKTSEAHTFTYMPAVNPVLQPAAGATDISPCLTLASSAVPQGAVDLNRVFSKPPLGSSSGLMLSSAKPPATLITTLPNQFLSADSSNSRVKKDLHSNRMWPATSISADTVKSEDLKTVEEEQNKLKNSKMMPPPPLLSISACRSSANVHMIIPDSEPSVISELKTEAIDESRQRSPQLSPEDLKGIDLRMKPGTVMPVTVSDLISTQSPSLATFQRFVSNPSDTPLPTQSAQSVEKYLSHIENSSGSKISMESAVPAADVAVVDVTMNKLRNSEKVLGSQFSEPMIYSSSQESNNNLLSSNLPTTVSESSHKTAFMNNVPLSGMFNSSSPVVEKESQKTRLVEQAAIEEALAARTLLTVGLDVVSSSQQKTNYENSSLSNICSTTPISSDTLLPSVTESHFNSFSSSNIPCTTVPSALGVSTVLSSIAQSSNIIGNTSSLIFDNSQQSSKPILPGTLSQESGEQIIEGVGKSNSQQTSVVSGLPSHAIPLLNSASTSNNRNLNVQTSSVCIHNDILSVNESEPSLINSSAGNRLDALVSSAIESRILEANCRTHAEKLEALVNTTTENLINTVSTENHVLQNASSHNQIVLGSQDLQTNSNTSSVQDLAGLNTVSQVSNFQLNTLNTPQSTTQITQENVILNNAITSSFSGHILSSDSNASEKDLISEDVVLNNVGEQSLNIASCDTGNSNAHVMISSPTRTSPIGMKTMIIGSPNTSNAEKIMVHSPPGLKSAVISPSSSSEIHISNRCSPPIAMKSLILGSPVSNQVLASNIDVVKDILSTSVNTNLPLPSPSRTSPIALKEMILESNNSSVRDIHSTNANQSAIAVKSILNSQVNENNLIAETVTNNVNLSTEKLNAFVHSSVGKCMLTGSGNSVPVTSSMGLGPSSCNTASEIPLHSQSLATILENIPTGISGSTPLLSQNNSLSTSPSSDMHSSNTLSPNSVQSHSSTLTTAQSLQDQPVSVLTSQSQTIAENSLLAMYSVRNSEPGKPQNVQNNSPTVVTDSTLLDHHINRIFVNQQPQPSVLSSGSIGDVPLGHASHFTSSSSSSNIINDAPLSSKVGTVGTERTNERQASLINHVLMNLTVEGSKAHIDLPVTTENSLSKNVDNAKYCVTNVNGKISEDSVESSNVLVAELTVKATQLRQEQESSHSRQHSQQKQVVSSNNTLRVPVTEVVSGTTNKETTTGSGQKKIEEGMVPQELTQMSESDLLSYINPSCFDQV